MKKIISLLAVFMAVVLVSLTACTPSTQNSSSEEHVCEFEWVETKAVTCYENGKESLKCEGCGAVKETRTIISNGHDFGEWYETKPATCKEEGEQYKDCKNCDFFDTRMIPVIDHDYTYDLQVVYEPTCYEEGEGIAYCVCGASKTVVLEMIDHEYEDGFCTMCGDSETSASE